MTPQAPSKDIHAGREGVGKGLMGATGGWGCERQRFYEETVRDPSTGWRLRFGMDEKVHYGSALDVAHGYLTNQVLQGVPLPDLDLAGAVTRGLSKARGDLWDKPTTDETWTTMEAQLVQALEKLVGIRPNYPDDYKGARFSVQEPIRWPLTFAASPGVAAPLTLMAQGRNGESFRIPRQVAGRSLVGTPDYSWWDPQGEVFLGWLDVKSTGRAYTYPKKWAEPEAVLYDYLLATLNGGALPTVHAYLEYRRNAKPYWHLTWAPIQSGAIRLARMLLARWEKALTEGDINGLSWDVSKCLECPWREAVDGIHGGCTIGQSVADIDPTTTPQEKA